MNWADVAVAGVAGLAFIGGVSVVMLAPRPDRRFNELQGKLREAKERGDLYKRRKDEAYAERNAVVALLAMVLQHEDLVYLPYMNRVDGKVERRLWRLYRGYDEHFKGWGNCLYIEAPDDYGIGQMSWHFPDRDAWMIDALGLTEHPTGWDKRTREEKYEAITRCLAGVAPS